MMQKHGNTYLVIGHLCAEYVIQTHKPKYHWLIRVVDENIRRQTATT